MKTAISKYACAAAALSLAALASCFTGIENTGHISDKDVAKVRADKEPEEQRLFDTLRPAAYRQWKPGKEFYVTDDNIRLILRPHADSLKGETLSYTGLETLRQIDNSEEAVITFRLGDRTFRYETGKTLQELEETQSDYIVPFLTDLDFIARADSLLRNRTLYIKTSEWKRPDGTVERGLKYVPVVIERISPGDAVYPFYVTFSHGANRSGIFMSSNSSAVKNMTFDKLFSFSDIRKGYKSISDSNWQLIIRGEVTPGMTKDECSLSLGAPRSIDRMPTHGGLVERWSYDNGVYLLFESGLLADYRK